MFKAQISVLIAAMDRFMIDMPAFKSEWRINLLMTVTKEFLCNFSGTQSQSKDAYINRFV